MSDTIFRPFGKSAISVYSIIATVLRYVLSAFVNPLRVELLDFRTRYHAPMLRYGVSHRRCCANFNEYDEGQRAAAAAVPFKRARTNVTAYYALHMACVFLISALRDRLFRSDLNFCALASHSRLSSSRKKKIIIIKRIFALARSKVMQKTVRKRSSVLVNGSPVRERIHAVVDVLRPVLKWALPLSLCRRNESHCEREKHRGDRGEIRKSISQAGTRRALLLPLGR